jgi:FG-GAP-like repeat/ASPIC and UnbV
MTTWFDSLLRVSTRFTESGIGIMDAAMQTMQSAIGQLTGVAPVEAPVHPPLHGPVTLDEAIVDLCNRLLRIAWTTPLRLEHTPELGRDLMFSMQQSFAGLDLSDPRQWLNLPLQLPLSLGTLATRMALRILYVADVVGPDKVPGLMSYMLDTFTDSHVMVSLQYKEQTAWYQRQLESNPADHAIRLKLGKIYAKLGLYPESAQELVHAATDPALRAEALSEATVASYREGDYRHAVEHAVGSLQSHPDSSRTLFWLWLAAQQLGGYPAAVPEPFRIEVKAGRDTPSVEFEDVAAQIGLDKTAAGRGTAVFDMDGDGYLDVVISSGHGGCSVYRNNGDGTFTDVTIGSGLEECVNTFIIAVGDYNNDGLDDLYITRLGFYVGESMLLRNNGNGTFTNVTAEAGVGCWGPSFTAQWVDYDCDGYLDLFVANNFASIFDRKNPNRLFHNNGDGTFTEVAAPVGLVTMVPTIGSAWGDYNNDGYPDLFLSSGVGRSQLFRNNGDGTFTDVSREAGVDAILFGSVSFWCDYDNDGWLDLVQLTWSPEEHVLHTLLHGEGPPEGQPMRIYHNNRDGTFSLKNRELGITGCWGTMSGNAGDFNNDGAIDFLLGNGDPHMNRTEPQILLENDGTGRFRNVTFAAGFPFIGKGHGANMADLTGDGRLCLMMASGGAYPGDLITTSVFRPIKLPGHYLNVRLVGTKSNRNAIGARVRLDAGGKSQHRLVGGGSGFGCLPYEQHFGLAALREAEALHVVWPSGLTQRIERPPINTTIRITEGKAGWELAYRTSDSSMPS